MSKTVSSGGQQEQQVVEPDGLPPKEPAMDELPPNTRAWKALTQEEREARAMAVAGKYAHVPGSVDEFLQLKREDARREEERSERRQREQRR